MNDPAELFREYARLVAEQGARAGFAYLAGLAGDDLASLVYLFRRGEL